MLEELITVIIPTYNRFLPLRKAIDSVLTQSHKNIEVIVIDDCSTHLNYLNLQEIYKDEPKVKVIRLEKNMRELHKSKYAQGMTRNEGIKISKGEWIAFLDDDDFYINKDKLETQIHYMKLYGLKVCCTNMLTGRGLDTINYTEPYFRNIVGKPITEHLSIIDKEVLYNCNYVNNSSVILHKSVVDKAGLQKLVLYEDYEYWKECIKYTDFIYIQTPMIGYDISHAGGSYHSV